MVTRTKHGPSSGGLSYWPGGEPSLFASSWAAVALSRVKDKPAGWDSLLGYLSQELRGTGQETERSSLEDRVMTAYALALVGKPETAYQEVLHKRRAELSRESRALLALAFLHGGEKGDVIGKLLDPRQPGVESVSWFGDASRERAIQLMAWSRYRPRDREVGRLVAELLQARRRGGAWSNTQSNAWAVLALSDYFARVEGKLRPVSATLDHAGETFPIELTLKTRTASQGMTFAPPAGPGPLTVSNPTQRNLYGETRFEVRPTVADQPRQDRGYGVSRTYQKLGADGKPGPATELKVGDRVLVTLRVETPVPGHFVAIDDPLPAILEAVNPDFQTKAVGGDGSLTASSFSDYREIRADRVVYFRDHLPAGAHVFRYLARVRAAGDVIAPAAKAEEMYRPERFGLSPTDRLQSK